MTTREKVFISYSRKDLHWLERLQVHLRPLEREGRLTIWDDTRVQPGQDWRRDLEGALAQARAAVLLVSPDFLASDFVNDVELPALIEAHRKGSLELFVLHLRPSTFRHTNLETYQSLNPPSEPLSAMDQASSDVWMVKLCDNLMVRLRCNAGAGQGGASGHTTGLHQPYMDGLAVAYRRLQDLVLCEANEEVIRIAREDIVRLRRELREEGRLRKGDFLLGRYRMDQPVGRGGFATVWKALDCRSQQLVAIKVLREEHRGESQLVERFFRGARVMSQIAHPAVVRVLDVRGEDAGCQFFVMDYLPSGNLRSAVLKNHWKRKPADAVAFIRPICEVLSAAHDRGIVHRDIKPSNILLHKDGSPCLTDFDLVFVPDSTGGTRGGLGTFVYAAPEQLAAETEVDARSDIFSLAMTLLFLLHGQELPVEAFRAPAPFISRLNCSTGLKQVLHKALQWKKERRYSSMHEFADALDRALNDATTGAVPAAVTERSESPIGSSCTVGIDFGTTSSAVAVVQNGRPVIIPNREGKKFTPSVVAFGTDGEVAVGSAALSLASMNPYRTFSSIKRRLGTDWEAVVDGNTVTAVDIASHIFRSLREDACSFLGKPVSRAVVTVPAYFNLRQRMEVQAAAERAGWEVARYIAEPTAAALPFAAEHPEDRLLAVYDLGGGTFDIAIVDMGDGCEEVKAVNGHNQLGGDDFDERIVRYLAREFLEQTGVDVSEDRGAMLRLKEAAEAAKIALSGLDRIPIHVPYLSMSRSGSIHDLRTVLTRQKFEELTLDLMEKTIDCCRQALKDTGRTPADIDDFIMIGLSTRIPKLREMASGFFNRTYLRGVDPDEAVALGAAIQASILDGHKMGLFLLDAVPLSLGIETLGGVLTALIPRNTTLPTQKAETFSTIRDNQTAIDIRVGQGERPIFVDNVFLAELRLEGIPQAKRGTEKIEVRFDIDANSHLSITVRHKTTGITRQLNGVDLNRHLKNSLAATGKVKRSNEDLPRFVDEGRDLPPFPQSDSGSDTKDEKEYSDWDTQKIVTEHRAR